MLYEVITPSDRSVQAAADFFRDGNFDGAISLGGGSTMDTTKGALVYAQYPASFDSYFAPPIGGGQAVPGPVKPHVACPTTSGTGSEVTGLSVILFESLKTKFVLGSRYILPAEAVIVITSYSIHYTKLYEYAVGVERYELCLPKGRVDEGEDVFAAANRELMEEVGSYNFV